MVWKLYKISENISCGLGLTVNEGGKIGELVNMNLGRGGASTVHVVVEMGF